MPTGTDKEAALELLDRTPADAMLDEIVYSLYVVQKIRAGLADMEAGRMISHEQVKHEMAEWRTALAVGEQPPRDSQADSPRRRQYPSAVLMVAADRAAHEAAILGISLKVARDIVYDVADDASLEDIIWRITYWTGDEDA
jgi:hypothetical protein